MSLWALGVLLNSAMDAADKTIELAIFNKRLNNFRSDPHRLSKDQIIELKNWSNKLFSDSDDHEYILIVYEIDNFLNMDQKKKSA